MNKFVLLPVFLLISLRAAIADPLPIPPQLREFLARPEEQQAYTAMMTQQWKAIVNDCSEFHLQRSSLVVLTQPAFTSSGAPESGEWRIASAVEGCGKNRILNALYAFTPNNKSRIALLPGTTRADIRLQRDALMYAFMGMSNLVSMQSCKEVQYIDTSFIEYEQAMPNVPPGREYRSWKEEWAVRACGVIGIVTLHFIPDATGTTISSSAGETRRAEP